MSEEEIDASVPTVSSKLSENHFPVVNHYGQPWISPLSTMLLGLGGTTLSPEKGIKLRPGVTFCYDGEKKPKAGKKENKVPQKKHILYLYEAGLNPNHLETFTHDITIYVTRRKDKETLEGPFAVATLSPARPTVPLELILGEDCRLSHNSVRKDVFFNGFRLDLLPKLVKNKNKLLPDKVVWITPKSVTLEGKELWAAEVQPSQELQFSPIDKRKEYHLLKVYSEKDTEESINLHVRRNGKMELMGKLITGCNPIRFNTLFDEDFSLLHTSNTTTVIYYGYTMPIQFKLKDLNEYDPEVINLKASPNISLDAEYQSYQTILAKVPIAHSLMKPIITSKEQPIATSRQPLIAPPIFAGLDCSLSLRTPLGRKRKVLDGRRATSNTKALSYVQRGEHHMKRGFKQQATSNIKVIVTVTPEQG